MKVKTGELEILEAEDFAVGVIDESVDPDEYLDKSDAQRVRSAVRVIQEFQNALSDAGLLE